MVSVGIVGGSGYIGGEALRVLLRHPHAEIAWITSRSPGPIDQVHPNLYDCGLKFVRLEDVKTPNFVLLALPMAASIDVAERFLGSGARVIDLGSAFRLKDRAIWGTHLWTDTYGLVACNRSRLWNYRTASGAHSNGTSGGESWMFLIGRHPCIRSIDCFGRYPNRKADSHGSFRHRRRRSGFFTCNSSPRNRRKCRPVQCCRPSTHL